MKIKDVAKLAGVSPSTVSRVINGTANVSEEKKNRILKVIKDTNFIPNQVARSLYKKSSNMIGVILPNENNPFFTEMVKYIEDEAFSLGYKILISYSNDDGNRENENLNMLISMNADGIILLTNNRESRKNLERFSVPIVILDRNLGMDNVSTYVAANHYMGGIIATEHLIKCGCKNIVNMKGPMEFSSAQQRHKGYLDLCKKYGIEPKSIDSGYDYDLGIKSAEELLKKYPNVDGIVASNDIVAISTYKILKKNNISVPEEVMLIGFDNIKFSKVFTPELTTIEQPIEAMGRKTVNCIVDYNNKKLVKKSYIFDVRLVQRETTLKGAI